MSCTTARQPAAPRTPPHSLRERKWPLQCGTARTALRRLFHRGLCLPGLLLTAAPVLAQESTTTVIAPSRSYLLDGAIVIGLFGLAVFAVCRSSRRS